MLPAKAERGRPRCHRPVDSQERVDKTRGILGKVAPALPNGGAAKRPIGPAAGCIPPKQGACPARSDQRLPVRHRVRRMNNRQSCCRVAGFSELGNKSNSSALPATTARKTPKAPFEHAGQLSRGARGASAIRLGVFVGGERRRDRKNYEVERRNGSVASEQAGRW